MPKINFYQEPFQEFVRFFRPAFEDLIDFVVVFLAFLYFDI